MASPRFSRTLIVVAQNRKDIWEHFAIRFADEANINVILDRRHNGVVQFTADTKAFLSDRREAVGAEYNLNARDYFIVREKPRTPHERPDPVPYLQTLAPAGTAVNVR